jgi:hypothetical protein
MIRLLVVLVLALSPVTAIAQDMPAGPAVAPTPGDVAALGTTIATPDFSNTVGQFGFFAAFWNATALPITAGSQAIIGALTGWVNGWFAAAVGAMLIVLMLQSAWTLGAENPWPKYFHVLWLGSLVFWISAHPTTYNSWIVGPFHGVIFGVSRALTGIFGAGSIPVTAGSFDTVALKMSAIGFKVFTNMPWFSWKAVVLAGLAIIYVVMVYLSIGILFLFYLCAFVVTEFCLALGPLFVAAGFFPLTRPFFQGWFKATAGASLQQIIIVAVMALFEAVLANIMNAGISAFGGADGGDFAAQTVLLVFGMVAGALLVFLCYELLKLAVLIAGSGSTAMLPRWQQFMPSPSNPSGERAGGGGSSGNTSAGSTSPVAISPSRQHAFTRTVGSAS